MVQGGYGMMGIPRRCMKLLLFLGEKQKVIRDKHSLEETQPGGMFLNQCISSLLLIQSMSSIRVYALKWSPTP